MELGYGLGIGLQVRPKDYVELVKSRDAAQAKGQAAKKAAADKALERTNERFSKEILGTKTLAIHQPLYDGIVNDYYKTLEEEALNPSPNFTRANQKLTEATDGIANLGNQYKLFETLSNDAAKYGISPNELQQIRTEKDPAKLGKWLTENGNGTFQLDNSSGIPQLVSRPIEYTPIKKTFDAYATQTRLFNDKNAGTELNEKFGPSTIRYYGINPAAKDAFVYSIIASPSMYESAAKEYRSSMAGKPKPAIGSPEEIEAVTQFTGDTYEKMAKPLLMRDEYRDVRSLINVKTVPDAEKGSAPSYGLQYRNIFGKFSLGSQAQWGIKQVKFNGGVPVGTLHANTGEDVVSAIGEYSIGEIIIAPVATKSMTLSYKNPVDGTVYTKNYIKGQPIPKEFEVEALKQGGVDYDMLGQASFTPTGGAAIPVMIPPGTSINQAYYGLDTKEKPEFDRTLKSMRENLAAYNKLDKTFQAQLLAKYKDFDTIFKSQEYLGQRQILGKPKPGANNTGTPPAPAPANTGTGGVKNDFTLYQEYKKKKGANHLTLKDWIKAKKPTQ